MSIARVVTSTLSPTAALAKPGMAALPAVDSFSCAASRWAYSSASSCLIQPAICSADGAGAATAPPANDPWLLAGSSAHAQAKPSDITAAATIEMHVRDNMGRPSYRVVCGKCAERKTSAPRQAFILSSPRAPSMTPGAAEFIQPLGGMGQCKLLLSPPVPGTMEASRQSSWSTNSWPR